MLVDSSQADMPSPDQGDDIFDVTVQDFEDRVMSLSMTQPVLVDFWAPWCGPCKQLAPVLEAAVHEAGGKIKLAKVNIDESPELAQALQVKSVPTVFALFGGQPVDAFTGVRSRNEIKKFINQILKMAQKMQPDALDIPAVLAQAAEALAAGDMARAQDLYVQILRQDESNVQAYVGLVRTYIAMDDLDQAKYAIDNAPKIMTEDPQFEAARTAFEIAGEKPGGNVPKLAKKVEKNPDDYQARFNLAMALFAEGSKTQAIEELVTLLRCDRDWEEEKARKQLLRFFEAMGPADPDTLTGRRKMSAVLFS